MYMLNKQFGINRHMHLTTQLYDIVIWYIHTANVYTFVYYVYLNYAVLLFSFSVASSVTEHKTINVI